MNHKRRSTEGWSIHMIFLDLSGGLLALLQMFTDAVNNGNIQMYLNIERFQKQSRTHDFYDCKSYSEVRNRIQG